MSEESSLKWKQCRRLLGGTYSWLKRNKKVYIWHSRRNARGEAPSNILQLGIELFVTMESKLNEVEYIVTNKHNVFFIRY
ncbi:hypothetical protein L1987_47257 [Smallanthus sonchifolius]|uniref:Uncharacterized protein n=1 Tax=Smallanthus sonchifolius TaxID=185202 RepID=A0ACB9G221_9ASTR|nr:hypothetical protein L1987_47257 [Smallanthus sonchifolius]